MTEDQPQDHEIVRGSILVSNTISKVMSDPGASHSFISAQFAKKLQLGTHLITTALIVTTLLNGRVV